MRNKGQQSQQGETGAAALREDLSDLVDGRVSPAQLQALSEAWADDAALRRDWQLWHLLGDSLRSSDLAGQAQSGETLLEGLRRRLADEPARPSAQLLPLRRAAPARWLAPLAVAAGFVGVALLVGLRPSGPTAMAPLQARAPASIESGQGGGLMLDRGAPSFVQTMEAPPHRVLLLDAPPPLPTSDVTSGAPTR